MDFHEVLRALERVLEWFVVFLCLSILVILFGSVRFGFLDHCSLADVFDELDEIDGFHSPL